MTRVKDWASARKYLNKGRHEHSRPIMNNTRVVRMRDHRFGILLHETIVVTYRPDGLQVITLNGWNTVTTRDRINRFSAARVYSGRGQAFRVNGEKVGPFALAAYHDDDPCDDSRIWVCRACSGSGQQEKHCGGPSWRLQRVDANARCDHGHPEGHVAGHVSCYRCEGVGRYDYGSNPVPTEIDPDSAYLIDSTGKVLDEVGCPHINDAIEPFSPQMMRARRGRRFTYAA